MEPGPLPPHERSWRHPSELGPTKVEVNSGSNARVIALATGTLAVLMVAAMIISVTPRRSSGPLALTATTTPVLVPSSAQATPQVPNSPDAQQPFRLASFSAMPNSVASTPQFSLDGLDVTEQLPQPTELVLLRTEAVTYQLRWVDVPLFTVPDGSVIVDAHGALVAHVSRGRLVLLADD
ncbi:MAG: hypothetical protein IZT58_06175 [Actinobacteria bacterium]|nr:hypothetical protein [Actinomycetota bacterium]